jgi:hypothetical protein
MKNRQKAVFGLLLAAAMVSAVAARAEVSIGGGMEGYMPSAKHRVIIILPAAQPEAAAKAAWEAVAALSKAPQQVPAVSVVPESVSAVKEAAKKVVVAQAAKAGKKARARRKKSRIASGESGAPKPAAPVSLS